MERSRRDLLEPGFLARLERLELHVRKLLAGEKRGEASTHRRGPGTLFREHREYVPGDDPRFLDWNAYLRLGDLLVKEYEAEESPRLLLVLDRSASMGLNGEVKLLAALRLAAALGAVALSRHTSVALAFCPGMGEKGVFRGRTSLPRFLQTLADVQAAGETHLLAAVQGACPPGRPAGVAVVLTDLFETAEHATALRLLRHRGFLAHLLHLVESQDLVVEVGEVLELVDSESGRRRRERVDAALARAYLEAVQHHFRQVSEICRGLQIHYTRVGVDEPVEKVVLGLLRRGALIR